MVIQRKRLACLMVVGICLLASGQAEPVSVFSTACVEGYPNLFLSFVFGFVESFLPDMPSYLKNNKEAHFVVKPSKDFSSEYWFDDKGRLIKHRGVSDEHLYEDIIVYDEESRVQSVITTYKGDQFLCEKRLYTYDAHNKCSIKNEQGEVIYSIEGYQEADTVKYLYTIGNERKRESSEYFFDNGHIQGRIRKNPNANTIF